MCFNLELVDIFYLVHLHRESPSIFAYSSQDSNRQCNYGMVVHQRLISRPSLWGKKECVSLTSTGLYNVCERNSRKHEKILKITEQMKDQ